MCNNNPPIVGVSLAFKISCVAQTASLAVAREGDLLIRNVPGVVGPRDVRTMGSESVTIGKSLTLSKSRETDAEFVSQKGLLSHFKHSFQSINH